MEIEGTRLFPRFRRNTFDYTAYVVSDATSVTVKSVLTNSMAYVVRYSDTGGAIGDDGVARLTPGVNTIYVYVISADHTTSNIYSVTLYRANMLNFGQASYTVAEGGRGKGDAHVHLNVAPDQSLAVPIATPNQGGASGADYSGHPTMPVWPTAWSSTARPPSPSP